MASNAEKIVNDFCKAFERKNLEEVMGYFTDDAVYHNVPMEAAKGKPAIRQVIGSYLPHAASIEFKVLRSACNGNLVLNERVDKFDLGGKRVELPVAGVFEVRDGKIALWRDYFDLQTWTRQTS